MAFDHWLYARKGTFRRLESFVALKPDVLLSAPCGSYVGTHIAQYKKLIVTSESSFARLSQNEPGVAVVCSIWINAGFIGHSKDRTLLKAN